jgi:SAM-dependent methyltransferase
VVSSLSTLVRERIVPRLALAVHRARRLPVQAPPGQVRFGDLRRTTPIASDFGYARGGPIDRHYIEAFLAMHRRDVRGRVLEFGDPAYTVRFGGDAVERADVAHVDASAPGVTFVGDLAGPPFLEAGAFDCIIVTQTLHLVYDFGAALRALRAALAPGGVLLMTVPGISNLDKRDWGATWHYSFTQHSVGRMCADAFGSEGVEVQSYGNVLAAVAFLHGLGVSELTNEELDEHHLEYSLIHAVRAQNRATAA